MFKLLISFRMKSSVLFLRLFPWEVELEKELVGDWRLDEALDKVGVKGFVVVELVAEVVVVVCVV